MRTVRIVVKLQYATVMPSRFLHRFNIKLGMLFALKKRAISVLGTPKCLNYKAFSRNDFKRKTPIYAGIGLARYRHKILADFSPVLARFEKIEELKYSLTFEI
jgi:hypothetical protein